MAIKSIWDRDEYKPFERAWKARQQLFAERYAYYSGDIYTQYKYQFGWSLGQRLFKGIRPLFLPFATAVDVDAGLIPGKWSFADDAPAAWEPARKQIFDWSSWQTKGVLYVHYGAMLGHTVLKVADLRDQGKVIVQPVDPRKVMLIGESIYSDAPDMAIYVEKRTDSRGNTFEYAEVITPREISTFMNGIDTGFDDREPSYPNELGFVPYVERRHIDSGDDFGEATFSKASRILDELNELSSYLSVIIKKHAEPQWAAMGAQAGSLRKGDNVWYLPEGTDMKAILADIDIDGVRGFISDLKANVDDALPEKAFDDLRNKTDIATATLELQLGVLVIKVKRCRPNYDDGLVKALQMAGRAAKQMNLSEISALDDENLRLDEERPVLRADLDPREKADFLIKSNAPDEAIWRALGEDEKTIQDWTRIKDERAAQFNNMLDSDGETPE